MNFQYPYITPIWNTGLQVVNPGQGGPQSNMALQAAHVHPWPAMTGHMSALFIGPSFGRYRPQMPVNNQLSLPSTYMEIPGLMKSPTYS